MWALVIEFSVASNPNLGIWVCLNLSLSLMFLGYVHCKTNCSSIAVAV
jgi:hypothetical protein